MEKSNEKEMVDTSEDYCRKCRYSQNSSNHGVGASTGRIICVYLCVTGNRRGCPVGKCDKFEAR